MPWEDSSLKEYNQDRLRCPNNWTDQGQLRKGASKYDEK